MLLIRLQSLFIISVLFNCVLATLYRMPCYYESTFAVLSHNRRNIFNIVKRYGKAVTLPLCFHHCVLHNDCQTINYNAQQSACELVQSRGTYNVLSKASGWTYYTTSHAQYVGDYCLNVKPKCNLDKYCLSLCKYPWYMCKCKSDKFKDACKTSPCPKRSNCIEQCVDPGFRCFRSAIMNGGSNPTTPAAA